jgi:hypothetical protein
MLELGLSSEVLRSQSPESYPHPHLSVILFESALQADLGFQNT